MHGNEETEGMLNMPPARKVIMTGHIIDRFSHPFSAGLHGTSFDTSPATENVDFCATTSDISGVIDLGGSVSNSIDATAAKKNIATTMFKVTREVVVFCIA